MYVAFAKVYNDLIDLRLFVKFTYCITILNDIILYPTIILYQACYSLVQEANWYYEIIILLDLGYNII